MDVNEILEWLNQPKPDNYNMKISAAQKKIIKGLRVGTKNEIITNPYSKVQVELCPEAVAIYDLVRGSERTLWVGNFNSIKHKHEVELLYDVAKDIFLRNWPKEYMLLLD